MKNFSKFLLILGIMFSLLISLQACVHQEHHSKKPHHKPQYQSAKCKKHPGKCKQKRAKDPFVNTRRERCIDNKGNNNGHIEGWEKKNFSRHCR